MNNTQKHPGADALRWAACGHHQQGDWLLAWAQITGPRHTLCEDTVGFRFRTQAQRLCVALADGVGGGAHGAQASRKLVSHCRQALSKPAASLHAHMREADFAVEQHLRKYSPFPGAATMVAVWGDEAAFAAGPQAVRLQLLHVGDARAHLYSPHSGRLLALTADQNYSNMREQAPPGRRGTDPAHMVGCGAMGTLAWQNIEVQESETLVLSSDGAMLRPAQPLAATDPWPLPLPATPWALRSHKARGEDLLDAAQTLCLQAKREGSKDDISVLLLKRLKHPHTAQPWWRRFF